MCEVIGGPELATDPRFADHASLMANSLEADRDPRRGVRRARPLDEWRERLAAFIGQWAVVQDTLEAAADPQTVANGYIAGLRDRRRHAVPARRRAGAVRRASRPSRARAPEFNEHGDAILEPTSASTWNTIIDLKVRGVVA